MASNKKTLGFNDFGLMVIGIPLVSMIMAAILFNEILLNHDFSAFVRCSLVASIYVIIYWATFRWIFIFYRKQFPKHQDVKKRLIFQTATVLVVYVILRLILKAHLHAFLHSFAEINHQDPNFAIESISTLIVAFLVIAIYEGIYFFSLLNKSIIEQEQLRRMHIQSQLEGLKNQVNPHFLFNSLNTLVHLIPEDTDKATRFVHKLSKTYRYILETRDEKVICLREELEFLNSFVYLLKERFGENLSVDIKIDPVHLNDKVIPLSLQLLVENAIKHNIISQKKPLHIEIFIENDKYLIVRNNLQLKNQVINSTKLGLENIKKRYHFYSEELVEVKTTTQHFIVSLPLIKSPKLISEPVSIL